MKNPHVLLADGWNKTVVNGTSKVGDRDHHQLMVSVSSSGPSSKKFKRKSREPKRLYSSSSSNAADLPPPTKPFRGDLTADEDSAGESGGRGEERGRGGAVGRLATAVQRRLLMPSTTHDLIPPEDRRALTSEGQSGGAIDMRIGSAVPAITARLQSQSQLPVSAPQPAGAVHHPSHRPSSLLLPQPEGHKLGLSSPSAFPPAATGSHHARRHHEHPSAHHHPYAHHQDGPPLLSGRLGVQQQQGQARGERAGPLTGASHGALCNDGYDDEPQPDSPQDSPRKRGGVGSAAAGGFGAEPSPPGRVPEIKALQQTRRLLANARERTRVHTISAAFEALRKQVPCYSYGQKLSKLAILRIACNYILSLAQLAELDYSPSEHGGSLSFSQCVEQCTRTLQAEGRSKKRKE